MRHLSVNRQNENRVDKFRIKIYKTGDKKVIGKRNMVMEYDASQSHNTGSCHLMCRPMTDCISHTLVLTRDL